MTCLQSMVCRFRCIRERPSSRQCTRISNTSSRVVIPVVPGQPPSNWSTLSPTGLIPVIQDGDYTLADSTAISLYLEKKQPSPSIMPVDLRQYGRALWFDAYAGGTLFRLVVHPLFHQSVVTPNIQKAATDKSLVDKVLNEV